MENEFEQFKDSDVEAEYELWAGRQNEINSEKNADAIAACKVYDQTVREDFTIDIFAHFPVSVGMTAEKLDELVRVFVEEKLEKVDGADETTWCASPYEGEIEDAAEKEAVND